jgi:very-short-patch-repair endonuclease
MAGMSIDTILSRQAGVIGRDQAIRAGLSRDAVDHRLRLRRWRPLHPRVYLASGHRYDDEARVRAAALWAGDASVLCGVAAAWWHGMAERPPVTVAVTVPRQRHPRARPGITVCRRDLAPEDVLERRGVAVTARPLTVLEAAVELGGGGGLLLDRALQRWVGFPEVYEAYCRNLGSHGSTTAGRLLVAAADRSACVAERLLVRLLRESGATGWRCGVPASNYLIDLAFPASRVAIEVDGWAWHMDAERAQGDKRRRNALVRQGWTILRYTWLDLTSRPRAVIAEIAHAVAHGAGVGE